MNSKNLNIERVNMENIKKLLCETLNIDFIQAILSNPRTKEGIIKVKVRPVRMDVRLANDVEKLARKTFRSQNDIAVIAMRKYLYENRRFFIEDMIDDCIFREIEPTITVRKESAAVSYGVIGITADKTKNPDVYHIKTVVRNKEGEYIFSDVHDINITGKNDDWKCSN